MFSSLFKFSPKIYVDIIFLMSIFSFCSKTKNTNNFNQFSASIIADFPIALHDSTLAGIRLIYVQ